VQRQAAVIFPNARNFTANVSVTFSPVYNDLSPSVIVVPHNTVKYTLPVRRWSGCHSLYSSMTYRDTRGTVQSLSVPTTVVLWTTAFIVTDADALRFDVCWRNCSDEKYSRQNIWHVVRRATRRVFTNAVASWVKKTDPVTFSNYLNKSEPLLGLLIIIFDMRIIIESSPIFFTVVINKRTG